MTNTHELANSSRLRILGRVLSRGIFWQITARSSEDVYTLLSFLRRLEVTFPVTFDHTLPEPNISVNSPDPPVTRHTCPAFQPLTLGIEVEGPILTKQGTLAPYSQFRVLHWLIYRSSQKD